MPSNTLREKDKTELQLSGDIKCCQELYKRYGHEVYGQFVSIYGDSKKAVELTQKVFEKAVFELQDKATVKGSLLVWLMNISRQVARDYQVDKNSGKMCIRRLVISEGLSLRKAAEILCISPPEAAVKLRKELKGRTLHKVDQTSQKNKYFIKEVDYQKTVEL